MDHSAGSVESPPVRCASLMPRLLNCTTLARDPIEKMGTNLQTYMPVEMPHLQNLFRLLENNNHVAEKS